MVSASAQWLLFRERSALVAAINGGSGGSGGGGSGEANDGPLGN